MYQPPILGCGLPLWLDVFALAVRIAALLWIGVIALRGAQTKEIN